jgi:hypothetical protein
MLRVVSAMSKRPGSAMWKECRVPRFRVNGLSNGLPELLAVTVRSEDWCTVERVTTKARRELLAWLPVGQRAGGDEMGERLALKRPFVCDKMTKSSRGSS